MSRRPPRNTPDPIDKHVGARVRARRAGMRISQSKLGDAIGVTFQQVQKYENGANRIGASNLYKIARELSVDVGYFFDGISEDMYEASLSDPYGLQEGPATPYEADPLASKSSLALIHDFQRIQDPVLRQRMGQFMKSLADNLDETIISLEEITPAEETASFPSSPEETLYKFDTN